jgi:hypothetical protein
MRNLAAVCGLALLMLGCGGQPDVKNRVPTVQGQLDEAQKAAHDAKEYADQAAQTKKDIQAAVDRLNGAGRNSDGSRKTGAPEASGVGMVTEVGTAKVTIGQTTTDMLWFTFAERAGFTKKFDTVCAETVVPVNKAVALNYHFRSYTDDSHPGCYMIDSYTVAQ